MAKKITYSKGKQIADDVETNANTDTDMNKATIADINKDKITDTDTDTETIVNKDTNEDMFVETELPFEEPAEDNIESVLSDIKEISGGTVTDVEVQVTKSKFKSTDKIPCKSLFHGKLVYTSPTNGARWVWKGYGAIVKVPLGELEAMNNHKPKFLTDPLIVILEPSVAEDFNFGDTYRKVASLTKLGKLFETGTIDQIRKGVRELLEVGMRDSVIAVARKCRNDDTLHNINVINMLNVELKTDLT